MQRSLVFGALLAASFVSTGAFADDITIDPHPFVSTRSQAEVQAELAQYKQSGINPWSISYNPLRTFRSTQTRAEVAQQFLAARDEVRAMGAEDSGSAWLAQTRLTGADTHFAGKPRRQE
jgi:hypothetical protein